MKYQLVSSLISNTFNHAPQIKQEKMRVGFLSIRKFGIKRGRAKKLIFRIIRRNT